jgi:hypothetical protein
MSKSDELNDIRCKLLRLTEKAAQVVHGTSQEDYATGYWLPVLRSTLAGRRGSILYSVEALQKEEESRP